MLVKWIKRVISKGLEHRIPDQPVTLAVDASSLSFGSLPRLTHSNEHSGIVCPRAIGHAPFAA